jgi:RNA polymerase-associated protein CTR9
MMNSIFSIIALISTVQKARRVAPDDTVVLYNLALVMQQLAQKKLIDTKSNLKAVVGAVRDLELSQKYFSWLQDNGDRMKFDPNGAQKEASNCKDTLAQAPFVS